MGHNCFSNYFLLISLFQLHECGWFKKMLDIKISDETRGQGKFMHSLIGDWLCFLILLRIFLNKKMSHCFTVSLYWARHYFPMIRQNKETLIFWTTKNNQNSLCMKFSLIMGIAYRNLGFVSKSTVCGFFRLVWQ